MRSIKILSIIFSLALIISGCSKSGGDAKTDNISHEVSSTGNSGNDGQTESVVLDLPTVQCSMCKKTIEKSLNKVEGVKTAKVDVKNKKASVEFDKTKTDVSRIEGSVIAAGYDVGSKPADKEAYNNLHDCCKKPEDREDKNASH